MRRGSLHLTVSKNGVRLDSVPAGCASPDQALQDPELDAALAKVLAKPEVQKRLGRQAAKSATRPVDTRPFRLVLQNVKLGRNWKGENGRYWLRRAKPFISEALAPTKNRPEDIREFPTAQIPYERYYSVRDKLDAAELSDESRYQNAYWLARVTKALIQEGLDPQCADIFKGVKSGRIREAAGDPWTYAEISAILDVLPHHSFSSRFLFWTEYSGGPDLLDAAALEVAQIDFETGKVNFDPGDTVDDAEFALVEDGLECLRQQTFAPGQIYVHADWIYTPEELQSPNCLQQRVDLDKKWRKKHITKMAGQAWDGLMADAKVTGKLFSCARKELVSFLSSMELKRTVLAKMQGITLDSLRRWEFPAEWEFFCLRDLREKHLAAIRRGEQGNYVISKTHVLAEMKGFVKDYVKSFARLTAKLHVDLRRKVNEGFQIVSQTAAQGVSELEQARFKRRQEAAKKIETALKNTIDIENRLIDMRLDIASECAGEGAFELYE